MDNRETPECQQPYIQLKEAVTSGPVFITPGYHYGSTFISNAVKYGLGEVRWCADDCKSEHALDIDNLDFAKETQILPRKPND